ncbi:MAG: hypothetical protein ACMZ64_05260 [Oleiphilus sp.]
MKITVKIALMILISALSMITLQACSDGTAENAGEKIDEAMTDAGNQIEDTCEQVKSDMDMKDKDC